MKYLEKIEIEGKKIRGRIIEGEIWIVANDITDLFGYKSGKDAVARIVEKKNVIKYPILFGTNGNQCNMINVAGINEILNFKMQKVDEVEKAEIRKKIKFAVEYFEEKRHYLKLEEYFVWKDKERENRKENAKKPFWKRIFGF